MDHHHATCHHGCRRVASASDFTLPGARAHYPPDLSIEPIHLDIDLRVDVAERRCAGTVTHTLEGRRAGARDLVLHAVDFEDLDIKCPGDQAVHWSYDGREIRVRFEQPLAKGEHRKLAITYRVQDPVTGLFFFGPAEHATEVPYVAATDHETERARHWLPTIDLPSCRPTLSWHLRSKSEYTILANGKSAGETHHDDGTKTAHWELEQRCPSYLTCFVLGDLVEARDGEFEGRPIAYYTTRHFQADDLIRAFGRTGQMLAWMTKKLGHPFPFPKYYQFALPGFGGAMENISLVSWDDMFVLDETMAREWTWQTDQVNLHEMAHSYFGDAIVCRDYAHAWLKESWAVYMETLWLEDSKSEEEALYDVLVNIDNYLNEADSAYQRPIVTREFNTSWQMYDRHLYPGGGSRLHMLRKELGDDLFFEGVRTYVKRHVGGLVETDDFRKALEDVSGRPLGRWFDQWIHTAGYPAVKVTWARDAERGVGTLTVEQTQVDEKQGKKPFAFGLDIRLVVDGQERLETLHVEHAKHVVDLPAAKEPDLVEVDPFGRVVMKLEFDPGATLLRKQLREAKTVVGRIRAARTLCSSGKRANLEAVRDAYGEEAFWGARRELARAMGTAMADEAVTILAEWLEREEDGMVLELAIRAAAPLRDPRIRGVLERRLDKGIDLYRAAGAAFEVLGLQRGEAPFAELKAALRREDPYGWQAQSAARALASSRHPEALDTLLAHLEPGQASDRVRPVVALAIGSMGRTLTDGEKERAGEALVDRLRDRTPHVRNRSMMALGMLGWGPAVAALRAYGQRLSDQERVAVDRAIEQIQRAQKPAGKADEKAREELEKHVRTLEGRVTRLEARADMGS
ncbi:MAG: M1 family aminopeptidase [Planctomycetota bacterium]